MSNQFLKGDFVRVKTLYGWKYGVVHCADYGWRTDNLGHFSQENHYEVLDSKMKFMGAFNKKNVEQVSEKEFLASVIIES